MQVFKVSGTLYEQREYCCESMACLPFSPCSSALDSPKDTFSIFPRSSGPKSSKDTLKFGEDKSRFTQDD